MIDNKTGYITFDNKRIINQNSDLESIANMGLGESQEVDDMKTGWIWLRIKNIMSSGYFFNISFAFNNSRLRELNFVMNNQKYDLDENWSDWSDKKELENLKFYQDWLQKEIGSQRNFDWGQVWADYDRKGGSSSIGLRYKIN